MLNVKVVNDELIAAKPYFRVFTPGPPALFKGKSHKLVKLGFQTLKVYKAARRLRKGTPASTIVGEEVGGRVIGKATSPINKRVTDGLVHIQHADHDLFRKNGIGGRTWIAKPGRYKMVVIFHDANRVGPHIDVHLDRFSVIYRVKPDLYDRLRYNRDGLLTVESQQRILEHIRSEIANGSRVPQNIDHSRRNARAWWVNGDPTAKGYGAGVTRQVVLETEFDVYKAGWDRPIEFYCPALNPHRAMYIHRLYPGSKKRAPICIWGSLSHHPPALEDRLHLKMIQPGDMDKLGRLADMNTSTAKYDGSSCYVVITPKGTTAWSPRVSKKTEEQIEYTHKLDGLAGTTSDEVIVAMGEVLFRRHRPLPFGIDKVVSGRRSEYLPQATGSGILNGHTLLPEGIQPEIRLYRVDRIGRVRTSDLPFWENRKLQREVAALNPKVLKVVELMDPTQAADHGFEGIVAAPPDKSIKEGFKVKWWQDADDWRIDTVEFFPGERGGIAGVVRCTSLTSGKEFKLGPSSVGDQELTRKMMANPEDFEGRVIKVQSRPGHEGRAAKMLGFHDDKGLVPVP